MNFATHNDPIVAVATAPGKGAVGVVRVSGRDVSALIQAICGQPLVARQVHYGAFLDAHGDAIDHGLSIHFPAPRSYTGEDVLELQAHGGSVVLQMLLMRCLEVAAQLAQQEPIHPLARLRLAKPGEFTERAFLNDKIDLAQAEAIADLIDASTEQAARSATRSLSGAFSRQVNALRDGLVHLRTLVEATLDFPEEEIDFIQSYGVRDKLAELSAQLQTLQAQTRQGALLREGMHVVITGQPNVGKSSLLNALAGQELAIVTPIAGTTRDVVQQSIQLEGVPLHVIDTAGLRGSHEGEADTIEAIGMARAWSQIERADAVLFLHDLLRQNETEHRAQDQLIADQLRARVPTTVPVLHIWNKADLCSDAHTVCCIESTESEHAYDSPSYRAPVQLHLSVKTGHGLDALRQSLLQIVGWRNQTEGLFIARTRHVDALQYVRGHLDRASDHVQPDVVMLELMAEELRLAQQALGSITGEFTPEDLLGSIFSSFCIGK